MNLKRKTKKTISTAAFLALAVAAIIFLNVIVGMAANKIRMEYDMTANKIFTLSEETKGVLKELKEDVTLYYFVSPGMEKADVEQMLDMYQTASSRIKIVKKDPNKNPIEARQFSDKGMDTQQNSIVAERGDRLRGISASEIYQGHTLQSGETLDNAYFALEQLITRAIAYVAKDKTQKVCFVTGHNELDFSSVVSILQQENIEVYTIDLKTASIPAEMDAVYIMAPQEDFLQAELLGLDTFLKAGKGAHIVFDARQKPLPMLEQYLQEFWGVTVHMDMIHENETSRILDAGQKYMFIPDVTSHAITEDIQEGNQSIFLTSARSLEFAETEDVTYTPLLVTSEKAVSRHLEGKAIQDVVREGRLTSAAALTRKTRDLEESRLVVSGSLLLYDASLMNEGTLANRSFLYGTVNYIHFSENSALSISPKSLMTTIMTLDSRTTTLYGIFVCILPAVIFFAAGFIVWRRRRHL